MNQPSISMESWKGFFRCSVGHLPRDCQVPCEERHGWGQLQCHRPNESRGTGPGVWFQLMGIPKEISRGPGPNGYPSEMAGLSLKIAGKGRKKERFSGDNGGLSYQKKKRPVFFS